jgi:tRNA A-37 threonylcarbamoyl transferase component Bud32
MKIVINPAYQALDSFITSIPDLFEQEGEMVYNERNQLKHYSIKGYDVIVKRYKIPHIINRIAYTCLRPSKAKRAYEYALKLLQIGVNTPSPIAYIEQYEGGLLTRSYFFSIYEKEFSDIRDLMEGNQHDEPLVNELSDYIAGFHSKGVLHMDMSPGNILYKKNGKQFEFTLIDINRMQFWPTISTEKRYKSFKRLSNNKTVLTQVAKRYAATAQLDELETVGKINQYSDKFFSPKKLFKFPKKEKS